MKNETYIPGKDASLESSIDTLSSTLAARGFLVEEVSWLNPVEGVWSVHLRDRDCPLLYTNGKGASQLAARASALGEFIERAASGHFWTHYYLGATRAQRSVVHDERERWFPISDEGGWPEGLLDEALLERYDPDSSIPAATLVEFNSGNQARGICALPFTRLSDDAKVWIPINIVGNLYLSNGISAGNTLPEARSQALSEVIERYVKFRVIGERLCLPDIPDHVLANHPASANGIKALREAGFGIRVKDASLGGIFPVICVALLNPKDQGLYVSFGAHPDFGVALERALTELLQGRALDALGGFPPPSFDAMEIASPANLESHFIDSDGVVGWEFLGNSADFEFVEWDFTGSTQEEYEWLCDCVHRAGHEIYAIDYPRLGVYVGRILVPGMSEIYPLEDLEWENNSIGIALRDEIVDLPSLDRTRSKHLLEMLQDADFADERPVRELIGLAVPTNDAWRHLRIGELRTLAALAAGNLAAASEGCDWMRHFNALQEERAKVYRCVGTLLRLDEPDAFDSALEVLFGVETLKTARALVAGELRFFGLCRLGQDFEGSPLHKALLQAHDKLRLGDQAALN